MPEFSKVHYYFLNKRKKEEMGKEIFSEREKRVSAPNIISQHNSFLAKSISIIKRMHIQAPYNLPKVSSM